MNSTLLHVCCGPCSIIPFSLFIDDEREFTAFFYNPNIHPKKEYEKRLETLKDHTKKMGVKLIEHRYEPDVWEEALAGYGGVFPLIRGDARYETNNKKRQERCSRCYQQRFDKLGEIAALHGLEAISTTLSISPYQDTDDMQRALQNAVEKWKLKSGFVDFKMFYSKSVKESQALGMYRQNFCGCHYSQAEANLEREARKNRAGVK